MTQRFNKDGNNENSNCHAIQASLVGLRNNGTRKFLYNFESIRPKYTICNVSCPKWVAPRQDNIGTRERRARRKIRRLSSHSSRGKNCKATPEESTIESWELVNINPCSRMIVNSLNRRFADFQDSRGVHSSNICAQRIANLRELRENLMMKIGCS